VRKNEQRDLVGQKDAVAAEGATADGRLRLDFWKPFFQTVSSEDCGEI